MTTQSVALALAGSGGAGVMTIGAMLLDAAARTGYYGMFTRLSGPQVRGGEAAALLEVSVAEVETPPDRFDLLVAIDWNQVERFAAEIPLDARSIIITDPKAGDVPMAIASSGARIVAVPMTDIAKAIPGGRPNMVSLGLAAALLGLSKEGVAAIVADRLGAKGDAAVAASIAGLEAGAAAAESVTGELRLAPSASTGPRWLLSGNEAAATGALRGGIRFVAGYPITPATEVVEWMAPVLERIGGTFVQAEDELAAVNMAIGGSYAGLPSMTATSGPGLSLMVESLGLAVAAEIPILVIDVQRGGPSTGIPTKTEQSDLNLAVYGAHGDAPRVVVAPTSIADVLPATQWATELAEVLQTPAILLSDQLMGQARVVLNAPAEMPPVGERLRYEPGDGSYLRYAVTPSGVSPMSEPGIPGAGWIAEGLAHNDRGTPSSAAKDNQTQVEKRLRKLAEHDFGDRWADIEGEGDLAVIAWGSAAAASRLALRRLRQHGARIRLIAPRLLAPLQGERLAEALKGVKRVLVVEQNHSGQLYRYLLGHVHLPLELESFARPGPLPMRPGELATVLTRWSQA